MAYIIRYVDNGSQTILQSQEKRHRPRFPGLWLGLLCLILGLLWMRVNGVPDFLIPGDVAVTRAAAAELIENMQTGVAVKDAVTVFCKEIVAGAAY